MKRLIAIALACLCLGANKKPPTGNTLPVLSLDEYRWTTITHYTTVALRTTAFGMLEMEIPQGENYGPSLNYVMSPMDRRSSLAGYTDLILSGQIDTTDAPVFHFVFEDGNTCNVPASLRPFIWAHRDGSGEFDRWWSNPIHVDLQAGQFSIDVPLTPAFWSSVYGVSGDTEPSKWASTFGDLSTMGITLGGGCFFGHGVNVSGGRAWITLFEYRVQ